MRIHYTHTEVQDILTQHVMRELPRLAPGTTITVMSDSYSTLSARIDIESLDARVERDAVGAGGWITEHKHNSMLDRALSEASERSK